MGMTAIEKIMARKAGRQNVSAGETVVVEVDMTVLVDLQFAMMWYPPIRIHDPDKIAIVMDHAVPAPIVAPTPAPVIAPVAQPTAPTAPAPAPGPV